MSIKGEINRISKNVQNTYLEAEKKGAVLPATKDSQNLAATVASMGADATATSPTLFQNETAYSATGKIIGSFNLQPELDNQNQILSSLKTHLQNKVGRGDLQPKIDEISSLSIDGDGIILASWKDNDTYYTTTGLDFSELMIYVGTNAFLAGPIILYSSTTENITITNYISNSTCKLIDSLGSVITEAGDYIGPLTIVPLEEFVFIDNLNVVFK